MSAFIPVILSGGAGTRLWPVSREALPKPFIKLPDGESLLQKTLRRAVALPGVTAVLTVTNRDHFFLTRDEYGATDGLPPLDYLLEPFGRNTAPAIAAAALHVAARHGKDAQLLVLPADHLINDQASFAKAVEAARRLAAAGWLVTFGIRPLAPETGFGYIEAGAPLDAGFKVARFIEKPSLDKAQAYLAAGNFTWNAGMFCFAAGAMLDALRAHAPELLAAVEATLAATDFAKQPPVLAAESFKQAPDVSIDYAVMEKSDRVAVVPAAFDWSDIGSWNALAELTPPDGQGNRVAGEAVLVDAGNCYVQGEDRVVAAVGVDNLLIVDTADALLVADRSRAQDVKAVVQQLKLASHDSVRHHRTVHRPWGSYTVLEEGPRFKIKRIVVKPGASLSLQMHHHRSEHWVVISGMARVVNGEREIFVRTDESTYIPSGTPHRLSNPGRIDCVMIEVQAGDYVGEDDIVRLEDNYGRC
ncbi:MAG: mannose-1-phosphate guanylyltransferase/mannose-6-phosphate isomerase [Rhodocyclaceae bacterium]|jgi:mannose-1-phosphate guanylyltransferase/mannose-6-phosphate isomerase|nr:mannose-1-phosphate guanylyltransferase/mannose-6-phosphate isomerase [Rhodocyclaceae bacterium]